MSLSLNIQAPSWRLYYLLYSVSSSGQHLLLEPLPGDGVVGNAVLSRRVLDVVEVVVEVDGDVPADADDAVLGKEVLDVAVPDGLTLVPEVRPQLLHAELLIEDAHVDSRVVLVLRFMYMELLSQIIQGLVTPAWLLTLRTW